MEKKRPFARIAGWAALWLSVAAVAAAVVTAYLKSSQSSQPSVFALALISLSALAVFLCLVASLCCGFIALWGVRKHGRKGILAPALCGLGLTLAMLVPVVWGMIAGFAEQSRQVKAREVAAPAGRPSPRR
jgi:uncharacterized BrkB/YihY/UPF0761 family membrane protein